MALTRNQRDFHECSIRVLTEKGIAALTWDTDANQDSFQLQQADRTAESGKRKGGGPTVAIFILGSKPPIWPSFLQLGPWF